jgi:putative lipase involved disintegration of autophagic bodies
MSGRYGVRVTSEDQATSPGGAAAAGPGHPAFLAFRFLLELVTVAVLAWTGASAGGGTAVRVILAIGLPVVLMVIWGVALAPAARRRLRDPARLAAELVLFLGSAAGLAIVGHVLPAVSYALVAAGAALLARRITPEG